MHRIGAVIGFTVVCLFVIFLTENQPVLNGSVGKAFFLWAWGLIAVAIVPLVMVLSKRDSVIFLLVTLPFFGICGAMAFVLPADVFPHVLVTMGLVFVLALALLTKSRKFRLPDLQPKVSPYMFAESVVIFAVSWVCARVLQFLGVISDVIGSSPIATNLFLWMVFFAALSVIVIVTRFVRRK
jgi:FtsH-binding integral membrane protein